MTVFYIVLICYFVLVNLIGFLIMGIDKRKAEKHQWRIKERTLFLFAIIGGAVGSFLGMQVFHHKTQKAKFTIFMPVIMAIWIVIWIFLFRLTSVQAYSKTDIAMDTVITSEVYTKGKNTGDEINSEVMSIVRRLDTEELSWREPDSTVGTINSALAADTEVTIDVDKDSYILDSLELCENTNGALDLTIHPIIELWGIETDSPRVPKDEEIADTLAFTETHRLSVSTSEEKSDLTAVLSETNLGTTLDLGAVGKGIAADSIYSYFQGLDEDKSVKGAVVAIGGTILTYGNKDIFTPWKVGIQDPRGNQGDAFAYLSLSGTHFTSTSGDYEQYFEENGVRYHHIFDPKTGRPADSGLMSVTVVCDNGLVSDGLSTACFVLGMDESRELLEKYNAEAVFVTTDYEVYVTSGLEDQLTIVDDKYHIM